MTGSQRGRWTAYSFLTLALIGGGACGDPNDGPLVMATTDEECRALSPSDCQQSGLFLGLVDGTVTPESNRYWCQLSRAFLYDPEQGCVDQRTISEPQCRFDDFTGLYQILQDPDGRLWEFAPPMNPPNRTDGWTHYTQPPDQVNPNRLGFEPHRSCAGYRVPLL